MKHALIVALILGSAQMAMGADAPEYELVCRSKAKEVAAETYRGCVVDARTTQIDQLKKDYQEHLRVMKEVYERQLKQLSGVKSSKAAPADQTSANSTLPKKAATKKAIAATSSKLLPKKTVKADSAIEEMNVEVKPSARVNSDDSSLDIPEPTPVEVVPMSEDASAI